MKKIINLSKNHYISYTIVILMTIAIIVCSIFYKYLPPWLSLILIISSPIICIGGIILSLFGYEKIYRLIFMLVAVINVLALLYLILELTGFMNIFVVPDNITDKKQYISQNILLYLTNKGKWATVIFIFLQFLQTVILPIPSSFVTAAGALFYTQAYGDVFGPIVSSSYSLIGILAGSFLAFFLGRKYGIKLVMWVVGRDSLKKILTMLKGRDIWILTLMFLLPFFPDDILCFVAGMSSMSWLYFLIMITISRLLVVFGTSFLINLIPFTTWWGILIWVVFLIFIIIMFYLSIKKGNKMLDFIKYKVCKRRPDKEEKMDFISIILKQMDEEDSKFKSENNALELKSKNEKKQL